MPNNGRKPFDGAAYRESHPEPEIPFEWVSVTIGGEEVDVCVHALTYREMRECSRWSERQTAPGEFTTDDDRLNLLLILAASHQVEPPEKAPAFSGIEDVKAAAYWETALGIDTFTTLLQVVNRLCGFDARAREAFTEAQQEPLTES